MRLIRRTAGEGALSCKVVRQESPSPISWHAGGMVDGVVPWASGVRKCSSRSSIARLGEALLNDGVFAGRQLIPADYVALMTAETTKTGQLEPDNRIYGLHCWICSRDSAWRMDGIYGAAASRLRHRHRALRGSNDRHPGCHLGPTRSIPHLTT
jgi:hypothetical protein